MLRTADSFAAPVVLYGRCSWSRRIHVRDDEKQRSSHAKVDFLEAADRLVAKLPGNARQSETIARAGGVSIVMMAMEAGDALKEHSAPGVVMVQLLRGHATLTARGEAWDLRPAEVVMMQPGVRHDVRAEEQSVLVLTVTGGHE